MYNNLKSKAVLIFLVILMSVLLLKLISINNKFMSIKSQGVTSEMRSLNVKSIHEYGYIDILECLGKNSDFQVGSINMLENEKCSVEVSYNGEIESLYGSLYSLHESENFLGINSISVNIDSKVTNISIYFKKNK
jgi:hypothetical protein